MTKTALKCFRGNLRRPMIFMAKEPINPFGLRGPLQHLCGYKCANKSENPDVCNRALSSGKPVMKR